jgi:ACS family pantothenate transporter-like MFS transporter
MKEDLNAQGNELNYYVVACELTPPSSFGRPSADNTDNVAYVLGQVPLLTLQTKAKMWAFIPTHER